METGRIVTNEKGEKAWWDGKNLSPVRIEPGTTGLPEGENLTITDQPPRGRVVTNEQGHKAWWDGQNLKPLAVGQAEQMQTDVSRAQATGSSLMGTPRKTGPVEPMPEPQRLGLPIPRPPGVETMEKVGIPIAEAALQMTPIGRTAKAAIGAGGSAVQDIMAGKTPSLLGMGIGAASSLVPEAVVQTGKWALRTASKAFGKEPLKAGAEAAAGKVLSRAPSVEAAKAEFAGTKAMTTPARLDASSRFATEANEILKTGERTLEPEAKQIIQKELTDLGVAVNSGKPLSYGEVFTKAKNLNAYAGRASTDEGRVALYKLHDAYLDDLGKLGGEAKTAVDNYRLAKRAEATIKAVGSGSKEGLEKSLAKAGETFSKEEVANLRAIRQHLGPEWQSHLRQAAIGAGILSGTGGAYYLAGIPGLGAASATGVIMSALVHAPKGVGVAIARSLVSPEGTISKNVAPAIGQLVRSYVQGRRNENTDGNN